MKAVSASVTFHESMLESFTILNILPHIMNQMQSVMPFFVGISGALCLKIEKSDLSTAKSGIEDWLKDAPKRLKSETKTQ